MYDPSHLSHSLSLSLSLSPLSFCSTRKQHKEADSAICDSACYCIIIVDLIGFHGTLIWTKFHRVDGSGARNHLPTNTTTGIIEKLPFKTSIHIPKESRAAGINTKQIADVLSTCLQSLSVVSTC